MAKKTLFPSEQELKEVRDELSQSIASKPLDKNATAVEKVKHRICKEFILYKSNHKITQKYLAEKLEVDESIVSKILHYHYDDFTIDRLIKYLNIIYPNMDFKLDVAS
jgi:predicted XRE-type DNA-binding protein